MNEKNAIIEALSDGPNLAPSILSADFRHLADDIGTVRDAGCRFIHYDVMDAHFVPNLTIGPVVLESLSRIEGVIFDVHLMISEPRRYFADFQKAGARMISFHHEADPTGTAGSVAELRSAGIVTGLALNPDGELAAIEPFLEDLDFVLLMSVFPGFAGQKFIPEVMDKLKSLAARRAERGLGFAIQVDGGVGEGNIAAVAAAGADLVVAGSAVYGAADPAERVKTFNRLMGR